MGRYTTPMTAFLWILLLLPIVSVQATDLILASAGAPHAPIDITRARQDPYMALSAAQRREIVREFRALLSMGVQPIGYNNWAGREISDCETASAGACRRCEIQMGQARAQYLFSSVNGSCRVQGVDVRVDSADETLLKDLKPAARDYVGMDGQFYLDENTQSGESSLRFVYRR